MKDAERLVTEWATDEIRWGFASASGRLTREDMEQMAAIIMGEPLPSPTTKNVLFVTQHLSARMREIGKWIKEKRPELQPITGRWVARFESWIEIENFVCP